MVRGHEGDVVGLRGGTAQARWQRGGQGVAGRRQEIPGLCRAGTACHGVGSSTAWQGVSYLDRVYNSKPWIDLVDAVQLASTITISCAHKVDW